MGGTIGVPCEEGFSWLFGSSVLGVIRVSTCEGDLAGSAFSRESRWDWLVSAVDIFG